MGYYSGNGVTSGGGSNCAPFQTYMWGGFHTVYQRTTSTVTRKSGVSLEVAQNEVGSCNLSSNTFYIGSSWYNSFNCKGTRKNVSYSQIGDTNLYELTITNETIQAKMDNGSWVS